MTALAGARVLVLGGRTGLLGAALTRALAARGAVPLPVGREDFDPLDPAALAGSLDRLAPAAVVNAVAYTQVDRAEDEPQEAARLNEALPALLARACAPRGLPLVHFSTDFVFDGAKARPYLPGDETNPLSVYGRTKLAGERAVLALHPDQGLVVRTAWLFGPGKTNFVHKIVTLAQTREELSVVHDQTGSPTCTTDLAGHALDLLAVGAGGVFHAVNAGTATWCELAQEAVSAAGLSCRIRPITTDQYPLKAVRPTYSVLDTASLTLATGRRPRSWVAALREYVLAEFPGAGD